jgi:RNA polymerase sigma-70 factor, ECF subfamily
MIGGALPAADLLPEGASPAVAAGAVQTLEKRETRSFNVCDAAMTRYACGDESAFVLVYDALSPRIYGYLVRQTGESTRAEDILQQTFLQIHRARGTFFPGAEVVPWAFAIARRKERP